MGAAASIWWSWSTKAKATRSWLERRHHFPRFFQLDEAPSSPEIFCCEAKGSAQEPSEPIRAHNLWAGDPVTVWQQLKSSAWFLTSWWKTHNRSEFEMKLQNPFPPRTSWSDTTENSKRRMFGEHRTSMVLIRVIRTGKGGENTEMKELPKFRVHFRETWVHGGALWSTTEEVQVNLVGGEARIWCKTIISLS